MRGVPEKHKPKGISPQKWGRVTWAMMHSLAYLVVERDEASVRALRVAFLCLPRLLPCRTCREHLHKKMKTLPVPHAETGWELARWVHDLHNAVNASLGKPELGFEEGLDADLVRMGHEKLHAYADTATRIATGFIARCLEERRVLGERYEKFARQYAKAERAYKAFKRAVVFVLRRKKLTPP